MATKLKDYYDIAYAHSLAEKIKSVYPQFDSALFIGELEEHLEKLEFGRRQVLLAQSLNKVFNLDYADVIDVFTKILGPEIEGGLGMFTEGWWLWPIGKYVELYGFKEFNVSINFSKELTKRFTSEFCMRPIIAQFPKESMDVLLTWSKDSNVRVRRLSSECIRIRLPWSKKLEVALDFFEIYSAILGNLKDDCDKSIQKSVANNLNDLYKVSDLKFETLVSRWTCESMSEQCKWIIKHGSRTKNKALIT